MYLKPLRQTDTTTHTLPCVEGASASLLYVCDVLNAKPGETDYHMMQRQGRQTMLAQHVNTLIANQEALPDCPADHPILHTLSRVSL